MSGSVPAPPRPRRILLVDDEEIVRSVIRSALDHPGTFLIEAEDGEAAIGLLLREPFDVLIADKNLPGITGLDVVRRAKAIDGRMGLLIITAYASRESAEEAMAIGIDDYLVKPFDVSELVAKVGEAYERRMQRAGVALQPPKVASRLRVGVCDPDRASCEALAEGVSVLGHRAAVLTRLGEALEALRKRTIDALVCDLMVLQRDDASAHFLRSALLLAPQVRFVAVASRRGLEDAIQALHRGAFGVIYRPIRSAALAAEALRGFLGDAAPESARKPRL